jgi:hypothetical protein
MRKKSGGNVAVQDAPAAGADVKASIDSRIASDAVDPAVLVLVVIDTNPRYALVI